MSGPRRARLLCVDDEPAVLQGLCRNLRPHFDITVAQGGVEALGLLLADPPFAVILSDMRMPEMDGARFLARSRLVAPDSTRILLTGHADLASALEAVNLAQVFRFLTKPCPHPDLLAALQAGAEQHRLIHAERELLERTLTGAVQALTDLLALSNPTAFGRSARVHRTVVALCRRIEPPDRWAVEVAAQLSQIGAIQLSAAVAEKVYFGQPLSEEEQRLTERGPALADQLLANIPRLEPVRAILSAGSGRAPGPATPPTEPPHPGALLLRLALDLDAREAGGATPQEALLALRARPGAYDEEALEALAEEISTRTATEVRGLPLSQLRPGLQLAEDLRSRAGVLLVARGFVVSRSLLMKL